VIDFDAMWASDKIAACAEWAQAEYAWLYGLADCAGCFELTNIRVIWGRVAAIRKNLSLERLEQVLDEFHTHGLLFIWHENGKRYGHWTGSDVPGRLPPPSWRNRLERLAPPVPGEQLAKYLQEISVARENSRTLASALVGSSTSSLRCHSEARCGASSEESASAFRQKSKADPSSSATADSLGMTPSRKTPQNSSRPALRAAKPFAVTPQETASTHAELKPCLEPPQAQGLGFDLDLDRAGNGDLDSDTHTENPKAPVEANTKAKTESNGEDKSNSVIGSVSRPLRCHSEVRCSASGEESASAFAENRKHNHAGRTADATDATPQTLAEIWSAERGMLPELRSMTPDRVARCRDRLQHARDRARFLADFREAVRRAAATPFLCGSGPAGWRANFDWIIANDTNYLKVLEGRYDAHMECARPDGVRLAASTRANNSEAQGAQSQNQLGAGFVARVAPPSVAATLSLANNTAGRDAGATNAPHVIRPRAEVLARALARK